MKKVNRKEPFLNSVARGLRHIAGSVAKATRDFTPTDLADKVQESPAKPRKRRRVER